MEGWRGLTGASLTIVLAELLLVVCSVSYLVWWTRTYRPGTPTAPGSGVFLAGAVLGGLGGVVLLVAGAVALLPRASWPALVVTVLGGVLVGAALLLVTTRFAHRPVTTELPLIVVWATAQLVAVVALSTAGVLRPSGTGLWVVAVAIASVVGLICYLVFYRLDPVPAFRLGMVPLAVDGVVAAALAVLLLTSRVP